MLPVLFPWVIYKARQPNTPKGKNHTMSTQFTASEKATINVFFNLPANSDSFELANLHMLESDSIQHPSGDLLEVLPNGYVVDIADTRHQHPYYFSRNFAGLLAALEFYTNPEI